MFRTYELPHGPILIYIDVLVECVELAVPPPYFRVLELRVGFLRDELPRS